MANEKTIRVRLLVSRAGAGFANNSGDVIEVGVGEAERMIHAGQAVPERSTPKEKAVK